MTFLTLTQPDDAHIHLRDGPYLQTTVPDAAKQFARAIIMPNLKPPITTLSKARAYKKRIQEAIPPGSAFQPYMTLYLTDQLTPKHIKEAADSQEIIGIKLYPAGVTTHSEAGIQDLHHLTPILAALEDTQLPLLIHGETNDPQADVFDRERLFLETLSQWVTQFPHLRMVLEHITTQEAVQFILSAPPHVGATLTAHHLLFNRNHLLGQGIRPHYYCLPILKRHIHQDALIKAAISGNPKFFLGTDSAPHTLHTKESACGCAGIYTAHAAISLYAHVFEQQNALDKLEAFASHHAADFYQLPRNPKKITLLKKPWQIPAQWPFGDDFLIPCFAGETLQWQLTPQPFHSP